MLTDFTLVISSKPGHGTRRAVELARSHVGKIGIAVHDVDRAANLRRRYRDVEILPIWKLPDRIYWDIAILEAGHEMTGWSSINFFRQLKDTTGQVIVTTDLGAAGSRSWVRRLIREDVRLIRLDGVAGRKEKEMQRAGEIRRQFLQSLSPAAPSPK